ncbi:MAG: GTPase domain-containing protein, partial [Syntrophomonadaceae bacterium]|nr:GTPase domain-containing protein [Syntrophomonadaceae bacterium]
MKVALLGQPNVGKSSVLTRLTGARVFVSNYPG